MIARSRLIALLAYLFLVASFGLKGQNQALDAEKLNQEFIQILNQHRSSKGLRALTLDPSYYPFVLEHSKTMARDDDAHHDRFEQRAKAYWRESGKKVRLAENAAFFYLPTEGDEEGGAFGDEQVGNDPATIKAFEVISQVWRCLVQPSPHLEIYPLERLVGLIAIGIKVFIDTIVP